MGNQTHGRSQNTRGRQIAAFGAFAACLSALTPQISIAGGVWIEPTYITRIGLNPRGNSYIQVTPGTSNAVAGNAAPACATNTGWQAFFSMAPSARTAKASFRLIGSGTCTIHPQVETISYLDILPQ